MAVGRRNLHRPINPGGQVDEAIAAAAELIQPGERTGLAPSLLLCESKEITPIG